MKGLTATLAVLLMAPTWASAQSTDQHSHGLGYVFIGAATNQIGPTAGFGGEGYFYKGLGVGAEVATAGWSTSTNGNPNWIGMGSADLSYHLFRKKIRNCAPFVTGGYTIFFGQDVESLSPGPPLFGWGNYQNGFNVGGGVDLFASKHLGVCFDVRYYGQGGRILWASFPDISQLSITAIRVGLTFR